MKLALRYRTPFRQLSRLYRGFLAATDAIAGLERIGSTLESQVSAQALATQLLLAETRRPSRVPANATPPEVQAKASFLRKYAAPMEDMVPPADPRLYVNWLGLKTDASMFAGEAHLRGTVFPEVPVVDDRVYGGYAEYASLLTAIEATTDRRRFTAVELGAGWGPWISAVGVVCKRLGFEEINLIGVEAHDLKCEMMREHLERNKLMNVDGVRSTVLLAAAWQEDTELRFPKIDTRDHGGAATDKDDDRDYRGRAMEFVSVPALSIPTICREHDTIDYMHWDVQGAELAIARTAIDYLEKNVRYLFIGTHSRAIEGHLLELFYSRKWELILQTPCEFSYEAGRPCLESMTRTDGEMFLRNPHFAEAQATARAA